MGVPLWLNGLRIWCCHCSSLACYCDVGFIAGPGTSTCRGYSQKKKKKDPNSSSSKEIQGSSTWYLDQCFHTGSMCVYYDYFSLKSFLWDSCTWAVWRVTSCPSEWEALDSPVDQKFIYEECDFVNIKSTQVDEPRGWGFLNQLTFSDNGWVK